MKKILFVVILAVFLPIAASCTNNASKPSPPSPSPSVAELSTSDAGSSSESVVSLMEKAATATTKDERIEYAKKACALKGIEAKILTEQELLDLESRQDEIKSELEALKANSNDLDSWDKLMELTTEQLNNDVLIFYNQIVDSE